MDGFLGLAFLVEWVWDAWFKLPRFDYLVVVAILLTILFVVLREGLELDEDLETRIRRAIRDHTTPRHVPAKIIQVADIPRTISGKIVELAVRNVVHGQPVKNTDALANPGALAYFRDRPELSH